MMHVLGVGLGFLVMHVERNEVHAQEAALTDPLTGCANRRAFSLRVSEELAHSARSGEPLSLVLTDIDRFKSVNDTHGHAVGDLVIRRLADVLREGVRTSDVVARLGGEEFCVLLRGADAAVAERLAERLGHALRSRPVETDGGFVRVTASFGVAAAERGEAWEALFSRADRALYEAKTAGRDRVKVA
jgi:diguanylate cyclase (GGDEF)-like protein